MSTELLCLTDSYLHACTARVAGIEDSNVILDRTVFYPRGGGQMADRGQITCYGRHYEVITVEKRGETVMHTVAGTLPEIGAPVRAEIDWQHRYRMMRSHTALHVLCAVVYRLYGSTVTGCQMYPDRARMDFTLANLNPERVAAIEAAANEEIASGLPVRVRFLPRSEANLRPELIRTRVSLIPPHVDPVRIVEIVGLDLQADGGTHVHNTLEVGGLAVVRTENKGRDNRRLEINLIDPVQQ